jgi:acyl dehydratase
LLEGGKRSVIPEEAKKMVEQALEPLVIEIEKGAIREFARALEDPNPLWQDAEYARKSEYGGIIAPPTFVLGLGLSELQEFMMRLPLGDLKRPMAEGIDLELFEVVRAGDTITVTIRLAELIEKETKLGRMVLMVGERSFTNQKGKLVARDFLRVGRY